VIDGAAVLVSVLDDTLLDSLLLHVTGFPYRSVDTIVVVVVAVAVVVVAWQIPVAFVPPTGRAPKSRMISLLRMFLGIGRRMMMVCSWVEVLHQSMAAVTLIL
jgi:hypothetical protein